MRESAPLPHLKIQVGFGRSPNLQSSPGLQYGPNRQAQPSANLVCIMSRRQLVKTSAQCTILLRYCQCRGPELASATLPLAPQLRKSCLRPGEVRFSEEPAWFCCACRSDRSAWPWLTCSTACSDSVCSGWRPIFMVPPVQSQAGLGSVPLPRVPRD